MLEELVAQPHCIHVHVKSCHKICLNHLVGTQIVGFLKHRLNWNGFQDQLVGKVYEMCHEKTSFCACENKGADLLAVQLSAFVFASFIVKFLFFNPKLQACGLLLCQNRPFFVKPGWKPQRPIFF